MPRITRFLGFVASVAALLAITLGTPALLLHLTGNPSPRSLPDLERLRWLVSHHVPDGDWPRLLTSLAWLAWLWLVAGIVGHALLALTRQEDRRLPLIGPSQVLAATLLAPLLAVMLHSNPAFAAAPAIPGAPPAGAVARAPGPPTAVAGGASTATYIVQSGDTLWGIAQAREGDGEDWHAIWGANEGRSEPGGRTLSDPDLIQPGWQLAVPGAGAAGAEIPAGPTRTPAPPAVPPASTAGTGVSGAQQAQQATASPSPGTPATASRTDHAPEERVPVGPRQPGLGTPAPAEGTRPAPSGVQVTGAHPHAAAPPAADDERRSPVDRTAAPPAADDERRSPVDRAAAARISADLAGAGLVGGTFLLALDRYRRRQAARRPAGRTARAPRRRARLFEERVRSERPADAVAAVEHALGCLYEAGSPPVRALRVTADEVLVLGAQSGGSEVPAGFGSWPGDPWWHLARSAPGTAVPEEPSCYPAVVTIGSEGHGLVLANLEAPGAIAVDAVDPDRARSFVRALATELSWSPWSAGSGIYVFGEIGLVDTESNIAGLATTEDVLDLARRVHEEGADAVARASDRPPSHAWRGGHLGCTIVICTEALGAMVADEVTRLALDGHGLVLLMTADLPDGAARWELGEELSAGDLGVLVPVLLTPETASMVREVVSSTDGYSEMDDTYDLVALAEPREVAAGRETVTVSVLGPVVVDGAARPPDRRSRRLLAYLAAHGGRVERWRWIDALWEGNRVADGTVWNAVSAARKALGGDAAEPDGYLRRDGDFLCLGPRVRTDIEQFRALAGSDRPDDWVEALALVRGRPFADIIDDGWLASELVLSDVESRIVDLAARLADSLLGAGRPAEADEVARKGLSIVPWDESLYRLRMRAISALSGPSGVKQVWKTWRTVNEDLDPSPESIELYADLTTRAGTEG